MDDIRKREFKVNNDFYILGSVNVAFNKSKSESSSHTESAVVTTITGIDKDSSITYNNVDNITYQGTQAKDTKFVYNDVKNITKESVELHNSYRSSSKGMGAGVNTSFGSDGKAKGTTVNVSASRSNQNTDETLHHNGSFTNVDEVHNNTGTMTLSGFNQEGGKVTGNIGKVEVVSRQNKSTTTGSSKGMSVGVSSQGIPTSVNVNASRTNGNRAFVDNQSTFVVGEGSNLHVGTVENTGAVIGKEGNSTFKIDSYVGKDIQNYDTMTTTGGSIGVSLGGKPKITNVGFNQDSRDKQGITRNTVVGDVEIAEDEGSPINRDLGKANEVTKDTHSRTNINVEPQVIEYLTNPGKLKEDIGKAKKEISDVTTAIKESIHDRGDDNRNFFGQLREVRLNETVNNIAGKRLNEADKSEDVVTAWKDAYKDLGYNLDVKYTTGEDTPEMKDKAGTAYVSKDGVHTIIININAKENSTKAGLIGTLAEEASHIVNGVAGRQIATGTEEKGLESTGRAANAYFQEEYKGSNQNMTYKSDGKIDTSKLGVHVGDKLFIGVGKDTYLKSILKEKQERMITDMENYIILQKGKMNSSDFKKIMKVFRDKISKNEIFLDTLLNDKEAFLKIYDDKSLDDLDIKVNIDENTNEILSKEIYIKSEYTNLENLPEDDPKRIMTESIRKIIKDQDLNVILQETNSNPIFKNSDFKNLKNPEILDDFNLYWKTSVKAVNVAKANTSIKRIVGDVVFFNLKTPAYKYNYYNSDGILDEHEFSQNAINVHELIGHPRDYASINEYIKNTPNATEAKIEYIVPSNLKYIEDDKIIYFENQYVYLKNKQLYVVQPFYKNEVTTLMMEKMVNDQDFGEQPSNRRFYYDNNLKGKELYFDTIEKLKEYFKIHGTTKEEQQGIKK